MIFGSVSTEDRRSGGIMPLCSTRKENDVSMRTAKNQKSRWRRNVVDRAKTWGSIIKGWRRFLRLTDTPAQRELRQHGQDAHQHTPTRSDELLKSPARLDYRRRDAHFLPLRRIANHSCVKLSPEIPMLMTSLVCLYLWRDEKRWWSVTGHKRPCVVFLPSVCHPRTVIRWTANNRIEAHRIPMLLKTI